MSERDDDRRRYEANLSAIAANGAKIAHGMGRIEQIYEGLRDDTEFVAMATRVAERRGIDPTVYIDQYIAGKVDELRAQYATGSRASIQDGPVDPVVGRFREMLT